MASGISGSSDPQPTQHQTQEKKSENRESRLLRTVSKIFSSITMSLIIPVPVTTTSSPTPAPKPSSQPLPKRNLPLGETQIQSKVQNVKENEGKKFSKTHQQLAEYEKKVAETIEGANPQMKDLVSASFKELKELIHEYNEKNRVRKNKSPEERNQINFELDVLRKKIDDATDLLQKNIETAKTSAFGNKEIPSLGPIPLSFKPLKAGKAKQVWISEYSRFAYYTPLVKKESELEKEFKLSPVIKNNAYKAKILELFDENKELQSQKQYVLNAIIKGYGSLENFLQNINNESTNSFQQKTRLSTTITSEVFNMASSLKNVLKSTDHLALDLAEVPEEQKLNKRYTLKTTKGIDDLEGILPKKKTLDQKMQLAADFVNGMEALHAANFVQGDLKPENALVYTEFNQNGEETYKLKISDMGKAQYLEPNKTTMHTGNPRFAPPEGRLSQKGEVYSTALCLVRILEDEYLDSTDNQMLLTPKEMEEPSGKDKPRRGIEKFVVTNKKCPQAESASLSGKAKVVAKNALLAFTSLFSDKPTIHTEAEDEVHRYIDALTKKMETDLPEELSAKLNTNITEEEKTKLLNEHRLRIGKLNGLLKKMTRSDPARRPTMKDVNKELQDLGFKLRT